MHMHTDEHSDNDGRDPLGLGKLPLVEPLRDDWPAIRAALELQTRKERNWQQPLGWLAVAAAVVLAVGLFVRQPAPTLPGAQPATGTVATAEPAGEEQAETVGSLIAMSQSLERQVREMREGTVSMPANSAVYVAELEDLVAQVDQQLSFSPDSLNLWSQRINLLLDLAQIYQHQWERDYGMMASL
jgi:negative regulator of sigma E activity